MEGHVPVFKVLQETKKDQDFQKGYPPEVEQFAPEKLPKPNRKGSSSNHHFSGAMLNFGGVCYSLPDP